MIVMFIVTLGIVTAFAYNKLNKTQKTITDEVTNYQDTKLPNLGIHDYENSIELFSFVQNGKFLLIYLLSECRGCQLEAEILRKSELTKKTDINIVFISNEEKNLVKSFLIQNNLEVPIFFDQDNKIQKTLDISITPTNFLIKNGRIERSWVGSPINEADLYKKLSISNN